MLETFAKTKQQVMLEPNNIYCVKYEMRLIKKLQDGKLNDCVFSGFLYSLIILKKML